MIERDYQWDDKMGRYRDPATGRFLSRDAIRAFSEDSIKASTRITDHLAGSVFEGTISPDAWREAMRQEIKKEYIRQYLLANGGRHTMTQADWGRLGPMIREQYHYLDGFYQAVADGTLTEKEIRARSVMYVNSSREAYETAREIQAVRHDMDEVEWVLGAREKHCGDCADFAAMGWQKIEDNPYGGSHPGDGSTACLSNCGCFEEYRNSSTGAVY